MKTAQKTADLPLHRGAAASTAQLRRMVDMSGAIASMIVREQGPGELLQRLSDPFWFQAFGCALGYDWHTSGVTSTVCGALKEAARKQSRDLGIVVCGGKGATSRKTPEEIRRACDRTGDQAEPLIHASRLAAKVDSICVQDGFDLYHNTFVFLPGSGAWCLIQQGLNSVRKHARRYHWNSRRLGSFVSDPHVAIACDRRVNVLNLVAGESKRHRQAMAALAREHPDRIVREVKPLLNGPPVRLLDGPATARRASSADLRVPPRQRLRLRDLNAASLKKVLLKTYQSQACDFEELLAEPGLGAESLRSLSMLAEVIYQAPASRRDPAAHSFVNGGKDGQPYPLNRPHYDVHIDRLRSAVSRSRIAETDKAQSLKALAEFAARLR